jgi:hypothetical protein
VANIIKLMIDQPLTDRGNEVLAPFSSDNPPSEVIYYVSFNHNFDDDDTLVSDEPKGHFPKSLQM